MLHISAHTLDDASGARQPALESLTTRAGRALNSSRATARSPERGDARPSSLRLHAEHAPFRARIRELVARALSAADFDGQLAALVTEVREAHAQDNFVGASVGEPSAGVAATRSSDLAQADHARRGHGLRLPAIRIGLAGGLAAMVCCVGPTVLAVIGVVSAATASTWAESLYGSYSWVFRAAGLVVVGALVIFALRRRRQCTLQGVGAARRSLLILVLVGSATYGALYALTTWLGGLAVH